MAETTACRRVALRDRQCGAGNDRRGRSERKAAGATVVDDHHCFDLEIADIIEHEKARQWKVN